MIIGLAKKDGVFKRGFKTQAERLAQDYRVLLGIHPCEALCAFELARHLNISVIPATDLISESEFEKELKGIDGKPSEWSALTIKTKIDNRIIIHNPFNPVVRQQSDIMHELAHIICKHERNQKEYPFPIPFGMHGYDEQQEEEAKFLGGALQISTPCLLWARKNNISVENISQKYNASIEMVQYRMNITGIFRPKFNKKN